MMAVIKHGMEITISTILHRRHQVNLAKQGSRLRRSSQRQRIRPLLITRAMCQAIIQLPEEFSLKELDAVVATITSKTTDMNLQSQWR